MKVVCQNPKCGKTFDVKPYRLAEGQGKFCSKDCLYHKTAKERFWQKVQIGSDDECWLWLGFKMCGYGGLRIGNKNVYAHRFSWILHNGPIPEGLCVCHRCDVPPCVNPSHLWLGSAQENIADMIQKGRRGSMKRNLSLQDVQEIRKLYRRRGIGGLTIDELASRYPVTRSAIYYIVTGQRWKKTI